jgi:hypothetical protein
MTHTSINLVGLDFDSLKSSLKTYLKAQPQFSDYDFDGSNMSVLLDVLSYNTYQNAFYLNMVASEMFLDSAQLRNSVVSIAKALNYTPRSNKSAKATLDVQFAQSNLTSFTVPEGTRFIGKNSNTNYTFVTGESLVLYPSNGYFTANGVTIYQGTVFTDSYIINYGLENQRLVLSNDTIDTDSIKVLVREDGGSANALYVQATSLFGLSNTSNVFFVQAADRGRYEVVFGDGVFGRRPKNGSVVAVQYRATTGTDGNGSTNFTLVDNLGAYNGFGSAITPTISVVQAGFGGANAESIEEIRFRAPRYYQTQERAVTESDFSTLITQQFQTIKSVHVYGGETLMDAPQYGKVFISPATFTGELISDTEKLEIEKFIRARCSLGTVPVIVDSDTLYLVISTNVLYTPSETAKTARDIEAEVKNTITTFNDTYMKDFNTTFRQSKFEALVDESDHAIYSNDTSVTLKKVAYVETNLSAAIDIRYRNAIEPGTITSSSFVSAGRTYQLTDFNPNSNTLRVSQIGNETVVTNVTNTVYLKDVTTVGAVSYTPAGTVDYENGTININAIAVSNLLGAPGIMVYAKPPYGNVSSKENDVIEIDIEELSVTVSQV